MQAFPPSVQDQDYQQRFAPLGLLGPASPYAHQPPSDTSNWLPAPAAPFRPLMRLYQPQPAILDGTYKIPPITKAAS